MAEYEGDIRFGFESQDKNVLAFNSKGDIYKFLIADGADNFGLEKIQASSPIEEEQIRLLINQKLYSYIYDPKSSVLICVFEKSLLAFKDQSVRKFDYSDIEINPRSFEQFIEGKIQPGLMLHLATDRSLRFAPQVHKL